MSGEGPVGGLVIRELAPEEFHLLQDVGIFARLKMMPDLAHTRVIVGQEADSGAIRIYWMVFDAVHVEPLWIHDDYRKKPGIIRRLWKAVEGVLLEAGAPCAFATIADMDAVTNLPSALKLGFRRVPGDLYYIEVAPEDKPPGTRLEDIEQAVREAMVRES